MYGRERRVLLRHYLAQGLSKAALARQLGISRRTLYHWLATGNLAGTSTNASSDGASGSTTECAADRRLSCAVG